MKHALECLLSFLLLSSGCSHDQPSSPSTPSPPAPVQDLAVRSISGGVITLTWSATAQYGTLGVAHCYEIRGSTSPLTEEGWDSALVIPCSLYPGPAGHAERFAVQGLVHGSWNLALKSVRDLPYWSAMSNVVSATLPDTPPAPITDLAVVSGTNRSVTLSWTAPGEDGTRGKAAQYDLRRSGSEITEATWAIATQVESIPVPDSAGTKETFAVTGLEHDQPYSFALKTVDSGGHWSELSNVVNKATTTLVRLTTSSAANGAALAAWSPDGRSIAFQADWVPTSEGQRPQIYRIQANGGLPVHLTSVPDGADQPAWSPDGQRIAFASHRMAGPHTTNDLALMDATYGTIQTVLVPGDTEHLIQSPAWSPDGSRIAYTVMLWPPPPTSLAYEIYTVLVSGGRPEFLTGGQSPAWSPDGTQIAFASDRSGNNEIWVIPAAGGEAMQLTNDPAFEVSPAWSPDGSQVAFSSKRSGNFDIWVMPASGGIPTQLTFEPGDETGPSWSPDGQAIAFTSRSRGIADIWILYR